jgi:restriction system protein
MPIPDYETLMLPMLRYGSEGVVSFRDAVSRAVEEFGLSDDERQQTIPSGTEPLIKNRTGWAITYLVKAGLLHRPRRAHFTITERGRAILAESPPDLGRKYLERFQEFREFLNKKPDRKTEVVEDDQAATLATPEERIGQAYGEITAELKSELLAKVLEASPEFFERVVVNLLVAMGYGGSVEQAGHHLGKSGDGGVDGVINEDKLGLDLIYIQAKRYAPGNVVGRPEIQGFAGSLLGKGANKGVFVTTSSFSGHAHEFANGVPQRIILIDGDRLTSLMMEHNVGVRVHREIELKRIDEDFFLD